jgi:hypothetical protein
MTRIAIVIGTILLPGVAAAHPDHSSGEFGLAHYLTDPFHVGLTLAGVLLFVALRRALLRSRSSRTSHR